MIVKQIQAHNFVTYKSLNMKLPDHGIIGIEGKNLDKPVMDTNAVGKTLILDMISYSLYGEILRKKAANIIGPFSKEMILSVSFYFSSLDQTITIKRERRGANEVVKVRMGGKTYNGRPRKMQPVIDRLLGIEWLTFQNCILYGDAKEGNFVYVGHSKRTEILAQIAGILHLREARKLISPDLKEAEKKLSHVEGKIETLRDTRNRAKKKLEYQMQRLENVETEQAKRTQTIRDALDTATKEYNETDGEALAKEIFELENKIKESEKERDTKKAEIKDLKEQNLEDMLSKIVHKKTSIETLAKRKMKEIESVKENGKCPTCLAEVDDDLMFRMQSDIPSIPDKLIESEKEARTKIKVLKEAQESYDRANNRVMNGYMYLKEVKNKVARKEKCERIIESLKKELEGQRNLHNEISKNVEEAQAEYDDLTGEFSKTAFSKKKKRVDRDVLKYWSDKFSPKGAEAELIVDLVKKLQSYANQYIHKLTDGSISIYINPEKETTKGLKQEISIDIIENGISKDFDLYSGGQKNRIEKAIRLGLMKVLPNDIGFKLFDEIGKDLSDKGYEEVVKLMKEVFSDQQIFLVTNDRESKKLFDYRMVVTMKEGKSLIDCSWRNHGKEKEDSK